MNLRQHYPGYSPGKKVDTLSTEDKTKSVNRLRETEAGFFLPVPTIKPPQALEPKSILLMR